jgi:hypothetical protein
VTNRPATWAVLSQTTMREGFNPLF